MSRLTKVHRPDFAGPLAPTAVPGYCCRGQSGLPVSESEFPRDEDAEDNRSMRNPEKQYLLVRDLSHVTGPASVGCIARDKRLR